MGKPLRVLMVGQSESETLAIAEALRHADYEPSCRSVQTDEQLAEALANEPCDVILRTAGPSPSKKTSVCRVPTDGMPDEISDLQQLNETLQNRLQRQASDLEAQQREYLNVQSALAESEERLRDFLENAPIGVCIADLSGRVQYVNEKIEEVSGWTRKELIGRNPLEMNFFDEKIKRLLLARLSSRLEGGMMRNTEIPVTLRDDSRRWINLKTTILRKDGAPSGLLLIFIDITDRKEAQQKILESEEKYRLLVENSREVIVIAQDGFLKFANRAASELFVSSFETLTSTPFVEFIHPDDREMIMTNYLRRVQGENIPSTYPFRVVTPQGEVRWVEIRATRVVWEGKPATLNFLSDITHRKQSEDALKESEERYRFLTEKMTDVVWIAGMDLKTTYVTPSIEKMLGFSREERIAQSVTDQLTPESLSRVAEVLGGQLAAEEEDSSEPSRTVNLELEFYHKDGSTRWLDVLVSGIRNEQGILTGIHGVARDVTGRKQAEQKLKESEERFSALFEHSKDCVYIIDLAGNFIDANQSALQLLGYDRADIASLNIISLLDEADLAKGLREFEEIVGTGFQSYVSGYTLKRKDGARVHVETHASLVYRDGRPYSVLGIARDVTERKLAQEQLQKSEEKYRGILNSIEEGYYETDLNGAFTFFNESLCRIWGYTHDEILAMGYRKNLDGKDERRIADVFHRVYTTGVPARFNYELIRKDKTRKSLEASISLMHDPAGRPSGFRGLTHDITERKEMEDAIRQSEEKYRTIIEQMTDGYFEVDLAARFTFVNDAQCVNLGYSRKEMIGMHTRQYIDEEKRKELYAIFDEILKTGKPVRSFDLELIKKDGTKAYQAISAALIRDADGAPIGFRGVSRDVTQRKLAELQLQKYANEISDLYNNAPCGYHSIGPDGSFLRINDTELKWLGYDREEIVGKKKWNELMTPESREVFNEIFPIFQKQGWINDVEFDIIRKDGKVFPVLLNARAINDENGRFIQSRSTIFDITQLRKTQLELRRKHLELTMAYEDLRKQQEMILAQEKMASIGMLAAGVAHEIKNPLAILLQGIDYLQTTIEQDALQNEVIGRMNKAVLQADVIVKGLLSYARQTPVALVNQDIRSLLDESLILTEYEFHAKNIKLKRHYSSELPLIPVDANQMKQVFVNLIINAIDSMQKRGELTIRVDKVVDDKGVAMLEIDFADNGQGIAPDQIKKIFDPFYTTKAIGNTGLGLSISKGIIDMHKGIIYADSKLGKGTTIIIRLPID